MKNGSEKIKGKNVIKICNIYSAKNVKVYRGTWKPNYEKSKNHINRLLLELLVLLCIIIMQQHTLQYTETVLLLYPCLQTNLTCQMWS